MCFYRNLVIIVIVAITTSAGAIAGYFTGTVHEHRRLTESLSVTYAELVEVIRSEPDASAEAVDYRLQGASALMRVFGDKSRQ